MEIMNKRNNFLENLILLSIGVYLFFLSRRGGDTKDIISILIMVFTLVYSYKNRIKRYLFYKKEIIIGAIYIILVGISYIITPDKNSDKFYTFTHMTIFSIGFFLVMLNFKLNNKYTKYILPLLILISFPPLEKGIIDLYSHLNKISGYRIAGDSYTTKYASELGIYFLLGIFSLMYYKKVYLKLLAFLYSLAVLILIFGTQSRNTFLALPITIIFVLILFNWKKGIIVSLILFGGIFLLFKYNHNLETINRIDSSITSIKKVKVDARYTIFSDGIKEAKNYPIIGKGFYYYKNQKLYSANENLDHYHNNFIETAVTQGLLTLIVYIIFLVTLFIRMLKNYFKEDDRLKRYIKLFGLAVFIFSNLYGLFEPIFYFEKIYQLIFTIITVTFIIDENKIS
ncbi:O-antigen ligase family protein [Fusobacterium simiae]|nr:MULTISPECIES: O-antigen ligase family protein [Fusobacterium]MDC7954472.1 O-antigen ligase family protein [Fusobacterium simiae]